MASSFPTHTVMERNASRYDAIRDQRSRSSVRQFTISWIGGTEDIRANRGKKSPAIDGGYIRIGRGRNQGGRLDECGGIEKLARLAKRDVGVCTGEGPDSQPAARRNVREFTAAVGPLR